MILIPPEEALESAIACKSGKARLGVFEGVLYLPSLFIRRNLTIVNLSMNCPASKVGGPAA